MRENEWVALRDPGRDMSDDSAEQAAGDHETQQASNEATERLMRLRVWLDGLLVGGPSLAEAVKPWREGLLQYDPTAVALAEDQGDAPKHNSKLTENWLRAACLRIRERRELSGDVPVEISEEEHERRLTEIFDEVEAGRFTGEEFTPLHVVLAARYVEGVIDRESYRFQRREI
jgi:hypothetical protein